MRALTIDAHGGLERLRLRDDVPAPEITGAHDVRLRLRAAALNRLDLWTLRGVPGIRIVAPWVLGADGMGIVESVGDAVSSVAVGDTVFLNPGLSCRQCEYCRDGEQSLCIRFGILGEHHPGTLAEFIVVPEWNVRRIPADAPPEEAAAHPLATLTAWRMCVTRAGVRAADHVLIWGIGGGVALAALQICKAIGARVWVTSGSEAKLARARALGADDGLRHGAGIDVGAEVRARTGKRGVDVILDSTGAATWSQSLGALGRRGRLVTCGGTTGAVVETDVRRLFWNQWTLMGSTMGNDAEFDAITEAFRAGRLRPVVDSVYPLARAPEAFERLNSGEQFGKVVVRIS